jgi:hypothetical protein
MADNPAGLLANGAAFANPGFYNLPSFPYANLNDQLKDALSLAGRGAGIFAGNSAPRYAFAGGAPNMGGSTAGARAYVGLNGPQGTPAPAGGLLGPPRTGYGGAGPVFPPQPTPTGPNDMIRSGGSNAYAPGSMPTGTGMLRSPTPGVPAPMPTTAPTAAPTPKIGTMDTPAINPASGQGPYGAGTPGLLSANFQSMGAPSADIMKLVQSMNPADAPKLAALVGDSQAHSLANLYGPGGTQADPYAIAQQYQAAQSQPQALGDKSPEALQYMLANGQAVKGPDGQYYVPSAATAGWK